jgi:hypothetical protein
MQQGEAMTMVHRAIVASVLSRQSLRPRPFARLTSSSLSVIAGEAEIICLPKIKKVEAIDKEFREMFDE